MTSLESVSTDIKYIRQGLDEFKKFSKEQFGHVKAKQDTTNGSVRDLREWRIKHKEETKAQEDRLNQLMRVVVVMAGMLPFTIIEVREYLAQFAIALFL